MGLITTRWEMKDEILMLLKGALRVINAVYHFFSTYLKHLMPRFAKRTT